MVNAAQDLHLIGFLALGDMAAGAWAAAIKIVLYVGLAQSHTGRTAIDDAANGRAVGFTKIGDCE